MSRLREICWVSSLVIAVGMASVFPAMAVAEPVDVGDAAVGLSVGDPNNTIELVGVGGVLEADSWNNHTFVQSVEFDNTNGHRHNVNGNLLGANFGTTLGGGSLYQYPSPNTGAGTAMIDSGGANNTTAVIGTNTRLTGIGVSDDNTRISLMAWSLGEISVLNYNAAAGTVSLYANTSGSSLATGETQGTAWIGNSSVESLSHNGLMLSYDASSVALTETTRLNVGTTMALTGEGPVGAFGDAVTDVEYNPDISPYIIASAGIFAAGTTNYLFAIDPNTNALVDIIDLSSSASTLREISWTPEGDLLVSQFAGGGGVGLDILPNLAGSIGTFPDNGSVDYYSTTISSSFNGVDVAFVPEPGSAALMMVALAGFVGLTVARRRARRS